jgi:hypothetical protein
MRGKTKPGETRQGLGFVGDEHYKHFRCFSDEAEQFLFGFVFAEGNALVTYALFSIGTPMRMLLRQSQRRDVIASQRCARSYGS